ncbi:unnamed protein product [Thelazia callipaeda]|uniref:BPI2 domain-containing protein n=1 Tax=Thelazia callipaeda TaxID=103827 RepID=A0A0N5CRL2_THECL|nr:unnamed protein product [Thelazia callipaeda]
MSSILMTTPVPISTSTTPSPTHLLYFGDSVHWSFQEKPTESAENANALYETSEESDIAEEDLAAKFAADLCADDRADGTVITYDEDDKYTKTKRHVNFDSTPEIQSFDSLIKDGFWAPDLTLIYSPKFSDQDVIFGLDAGAVLYGRKASNVNRPDMLNVSAFGDQMFGIIISEYVPNTFFAHVYDERVPIIRETLRAQNLPRFIKPVAKFLCGRCELQLIANLTRRPYITINKNGVKMDIQVDLAIRFLAKTKQHVIVNGNAALDITVRPYLKHSRLYGDVALTSIDIKLKEMGIGGIFANSVRKAFNAIIPKKLWPAIKKRLRFAFNQRGIRLPVMCGVELEKPSLSYIHHAIVIDTDFSYDLQRFVRKFKSYIHAEVARARKKELMENEEDY